MMFPFFGEYIAAKRALRGGGYWPVSHQNVIGPPMQSPPLRHKDFMPVQAVTSTTLSSVSATEDFCLTCFEC